MRGSRAIWRLILAAALTGVLMSAAALTSEAAFHLTVVSKTSGGVSGNGYSTTEGSGGAISRNGKRAAFASRASNLPSGDGSTFRCYVRNIATGKTRLVSVTSAGVPATGDTFSCALSANGRFVAFHGQGDGLPGSGGEGQVWVHDLKTGKTRLASQNADGEPAMGGDAEYPSLSASGRYVVFQSYASNFPGADSDDLVYIRDMKRGKLLVGSRTKGGDPAYGGVYGQPMSADGRVLAFFSNDADLPHSSGVDHVYVRDRKTGKVTIADRTSGGTLANDDARDVSISGNGRYVVFDSEATNLPGGAGPGGQSYRHDLKTGKTVLVSQTSSGNPQNGYAYYPHASGDGRYVVFYADGANLPQGDGSTDEIYLRDIRKHKTRLLSVAANGDAANAYAEYPSISLDGHWVLFYSGATNLGGNPANQNVFRAGPIG